MVVPVKVAEAEAVVGGLVAGDPVSSFVHIHGGFVRVVARFTCQCVIFS